MSDFKPNRIRFKSRNCMNAILRLADAYMSKTSDIMIHLFKLEIDRNGNGSKYMKDDAKKVVREIMHEVLEDHIDVTVGFDENMARSMAKDFYVRVMVVIHGNQASGPIFEKPGQATWKKNVIGYGVPDPDTRTYEPIPQFDQFDVAEGIKSNVMKDIEKYMLQMMAEIVSHLDAGFFAGFLTVG